MVRSYFKVAIRNLRRNQLHALIGISGLALAMVCSTTIFLWIQKEASYDRFNTHYPHIYRVLTQFHPGAEYWASSPGPLAEDLMARCPEVQYATRFRGTQERVFRYQNQDFSETGVAVTDPSFFKIFTIPFLEGDPSSALASPDELVLTESMAKKYFGAGGALGKTLEMDNRLFKVSGVISDVPAASHFHFDCLIPFEYAKQEIPIFDSWGNYPLYTYLKLMNNARPDSVSSQIKNLILERTPYRKDIHFSLQPLSAVHFTTTLFNDDSVTVNPNYLTLFSAVAVFILLIAWINHASLATARMSSRFKEVGLRKTIGASKRDLVLQFLGETTVLTFISMVLSIVLLEALNPLVNRFSGQPLPVHYNHFSIILYYFLLLIATTLFSGLYPAFYFSSSAPLKVIKGTFLGSKSQFNFRKLFLVVQFTLAIALIGSTLIVNNQVRYLRNKDLGFRKEQKVCVDIKKDQVKNVIAFKNALLGMPDILGVSVKNCSPNAVMQASDGIEWAGKDPDKKVMWELSWIDPDYFPNFSVVFQQGRNFSDDFSTDAGEGVIINEAGARLMGMEDAVGQSITVRHTPRTIVGIIRDTNFHSLHQQVEPQIYMLMTDNLMAERGCTCLMNISPNTEASLSEIEKCWKSTGFTRPFHYSFLDDTYARFYHEERKMRQLFNSFTFLALFIAGLGLFSMISYVTEKRIKEIGVRKVLGASVPEVVFLLVSDFIRWILTANLFAWPIAWYAMHKWLQNFAYRIDLTIWPFLLSGLLALFIALITVSWQAIRAATANPIKSLHYE